MNGYAGYLLRINLANRKITREHLNPKTAQMFLGGSGYAAKILWDELEPKIDPLGRGNKFIIATGPLVGTLCPGTDSWVACFKSPLTNCWGESRSGGGFGPELKRAGYDFVVLEDSSDEPVYIWIRDGEVEIREAKHLWGKTIPEVEGKLRKEGDSEARIASIGPAGENLVRFASVMTGGRAAGRCGGGAVLGSKKVKAIMVQGHGGVSVAEPEAFLAAISEVEKVQSKLEVCGTTQGCFGAGTMSFISFFDKSGAIPTKYGASNCWDEKGDEFYRQLRDRYVAGSGSCEGCTMSCTKYTKVKEGKWKTPLTHGPEYESIACFGHLMLNDNVEAIIHASHLCDIYGMDTISCASVIAFAMECYEKGWINKNDTDGLELTWGNMDSVKMLIENIAKSKGFGNLLGEGTKRVAKKIGGEAPGIALHVKGLDIPAHDPRGHYAGKAWLVQYATANRGGCHIHPQEPTLVMSARYNKDLGIRFSEGSELKENEFPPAATDPLTLEGKVKVVLWTQNYGDAQESIGACKFHNYATAAFNPETYAKITSYATGINITPSELTKIGERVFNLERCFNVREGIRRKDDSIPKRLCLVPTFGPFSQDSKRATSKEELDAMLDEYYQARGWEKETGIPSEQKLRELGLGNVAEGLAKYIEEI